MRSSRPHAILVLLLVASLSAGCMGGAKKAPEPTTTYDTSGTEPGNATLLGRAVNVEQAPLVGATVKIAAIASINAPTNEAGNFTLFNVPPGSHLLVVQAPGYRDGRKGIQVVADEVVTDLNFILEPIEIKGQPYSELYQDEGFYSCGYDHSMVPPPEQFTQTCSTDANHDPVYEFPVNLEAGPFSIVLELEWQPASPNTGQRLRQGLWMDPVCDQNGCRSDAVIGDISGTGPLSRAYGSLQRPILEHLRPNARIASGVSLPFPQPPPPEGDPSESYLVVQQPFTHYVAVFYNSEPADGFTQLGGGEG